MYSLVLCEVVLYRWSGAVEGWDVAEGFVLQHAGADPPGELLDLFLDVGEESIGAPAADQHDGVDRLFGEVHKHGEAPSHRM